MMMMMMKVNLVLQLSQADDEELDDNKDFTVDLSESDTNTIDSLKLETT